jgi:hypothetical protein
VKEPKAVRSLESRISHNKTSSVQKPLLNVVDDKKSNYPEIYDRLVSKAGEFDSNSYAIYRLANNGDELPTFVFRSLM